MMANTMQQPHQEDSRDERGEDTTLPRDKYTTATHTKTSVTTRTGELGHFYRFGVLTASRHGYAPSCLTDLTVLT